MRASTLVSLLGIGLGLASVARSEPKAPEPAPIQLDSAVFGAIEARSIGPAVMSGRIMAIDGSSQDPSLLYVGAANGGVWKSKNGGISFEPVFDKNTQSIGDVKVAPSDPNIVWVGTGEDCVRNSVSIGSGVYKSTDGGENWASMGLEKTERIARIQVHPKDPNIVYACALGHLWDASDDRGLYKTLDGGKTWNQLLFVDGGTGCADLAIDPQEPDNLYAALWQFRRSPYGFTSGGPGSGLYRSSDGGKSWKRLTKGLPEGDLGRIAIAVAPSRPNTLYANVEAKKTALYRSEDLGESWALMDSSFGIQARPFYFSHLAVDPQDHRRLYKPGLFLSISSDGGRSFSQAFGEGTHSDEHALWINPQDPRNLVLGTDGGVYVSRDRGANWLAVGSLPLSQFYHVSYDLARPYNVYGGLQDNGSWMGPSRSPNGVQGRDWKPVGMGDGFYAMPDPVDQDIVYSEYQGGELLRYSHSTGETKRIKPFPAEGEPRLRFNWNTPFALSRKQPGVLYLGAQYVLRSRDRGESWDKISPDLTTNDPEKQRQEESGGLTIDNSTAENHCTVYAIADSPLDGDVIWAGTDDGNLQVTQDGGKTWANVVRNVPGLPPGTWVSSVETSPHDRATAFATFDGHQTGDMKTYLYKTTDLGQTWTSLATDALKGYAHVLRQDLVNPELLFLGTELGLFVSVDGGEQWAQFTGKLPGVAVRDLAIHPREQDLIVATHGRGLYIIDDITPLRKLTSEILQADAAILESRPMEIRNPQGEQEFAGSSEFVGENPPEAAVITYYLKKRHMMGDLKLEVYDAEGKRVADLPTGKRRGLNRSLWYMRLPPPKVPPAPNLAGGALFGPMVPEGLYTVKLLQNDKAYPGSIRLVPDPVLPYPEADRKLQSQTTLRLYRMQEQLAYVADAISLLRDQARDRAKSLPEGEALPKTLGEFADRLEEFRKTLVATKPGWLTGEEKLREQVVGVYGAVSGYGGRPTASQLARTEALDKQIQAAQASFEAIAKDQLTELNSKLQSLQKPPLELLTEEAWKQRQK